MKTLNATLYKNMLSVLCSKKLRTTQTAVLFSRAIATWPSKSPYCLALHRFISYLEKDIYDFDLIMDMMTEEGEDKEIINTIKNLHNTPTIRTMNELGALVRAITDYVKYANMLKASTPFIQTLDIIDDTEIDNLPQYVEQLKNCAQNILSAYNSVSTSAAAHTFDSSDPDAMKISIADAKSARSPDKCILTGIRGLNNLLSPGYLSGCVYVFAALPGNYKSGILLKSHVDTLKYNSHIKNTTNGKTPISMYISMENTMAQTIRRLWGILYPSADMSTYSVDEITTMINDELTAQGMRSVILYYGYREKSTSDLANIIRSFNNDENEVVAVYLDYIKRIRPGRTDASVTASEKSELHAIMNELKSIAAEFNIPIVTGHQLNREAARQVDDVVKNGGYNSTDQALGRANISVAWEVMEVADFLGLMNIENNGESKSLMIKAVKQRDLDSNTDNAITAIRHPFLSPQSFALKDDILENVPSSTPIFMMKQKMNYLAAV